MKPTPAILFAAIAGAVVLAAVVAGLFVIGTPGQARLRGLDGQRISALQQISSDVDVYSAGHGALPQTLEALAQQQNDLTPALIRDPVSGAPYEYRVTGAGSYELCARFALQSDPDEAIRWRHGPGRGCFESTAAHGPQPQTSQAN